MELVSFSTSDILRCKCFGTLSQLKHAHKNILNHPNLEVYKVRNRIDTSNRDFLINAKLKDSALLC